MNLQAFDLLLVKGDSWVSNTIKGISNSPYSHVAIVLNEYFVFETKFNKPFAIYSNEYTPDDYDVYRYKGDLSPFQKYCMQRFLIENRDKKYDLLKTVSNGLFILFKFPIVDVVERLNCVESAKGLYKSIGIELEGYTPEDISNNDCLVKVD